MTDDVLDRLPPMDIPSEKSALGSAMLSADAAGQVVEKLRVDDFCRPAHQMVFQAVHSLYGKGQPVNPVTVHGELGNVCAAGDTAPSGGYLHDLIEQVPAVSAVGYYITRLRNVGHLRRLGGVGPAITQLAYGTAPEEAEYALEAANKLLDEATQTADLGVARSVADLITPFMDALEAGGDKRGVATGWVDLGRLVPRLRPGQLITVGARPGIGKTVVMACLAHYVGVKLGQPVLIGTLEMSTEEFMARLVAHDARVNLARILEPDLLTGDDWDRLGKSHARLSEAGTLEIDDTPGMTIGHIRAQLRAMRRAGRPAALVVIDYLQLMESGRKVESRQVEVSQFSRALKLLAKEFEVPVVIGSQLNREVEKRADKKPTLADLRESGSVEQDSDVVILLHREDASDPESPRAGEIDLVVDKNRSGPKGVATLVFQGHFGRVVDMAPRDNWTPTGALQ